jgi:hypothetical protein
VNNDAPIPGHILGRKGSPNTAGVPEEVRHLLNTGRIEAVNLSEWLVVDQGAIAAHCLPALGLGQHVPAITGALQLLEALGKSTTPKRNAAVASALHTGLGSTRAVERALKDLRQHPSDVIRCWACELVAAHAPWSLADKLDRIRPVAADAAPAGGVSSSTEKKSIVRTKFLTLATSILHRLRKSCVPTRRAAASRMAPRSRPPSSQKKYLYWRQRAEKRAEKSAGAGRQLSTRMSGGSCRFSSAT